MTVNPKPKSRMLVVYTPDYACVPFRIVHDSSVQKGDDLKIAAKWEAKKAVDPDTKIYHVGPRITNEEFLRFLNGSMEICTQSKMDRMDDHVIALRSKQGTTRKS